MGIEPRDWLGGQGSAIELHPQAFFETILFKRLYYTFSEKVQAKS